MSLNVTMSALKGSINRIPLVDATLTKTGWAADAKVTGEQLRNISGAGELSANAIAKAGNAESVANAANATANSAKATAAAAQTAAENAATAAATAQSTANAALPITGGQLTGYARAVSPSTGRNDGELYNIRVVNNAYNAVLGGYRYIDFQLKG